MVAENDRMGDGALAELVHHAKVGIMSVADEEKSDFYKDASRGDWGGVDISHNNYKSLYETSVRIFGEDDALSLSMKGKLELMKEKKLQNGE